MKITKELLIKIIKEELNELRIDTVAGYHSDQGQTISSKDEKPPELVAWLKTQPDGLEIEMDERGEWVVYYDSLDGVNADNLPVGWSSEVNALGGSDEDSSYIISRDDAEVK